MSVVMNMAGILLLRTTIYPVPRSSGGEDPVVGEKILWLGEDHVVGEKIMWSRRWEARHEIFESVVVRRRRPKRRREDEKTETKTKARRREDGDGDEDEDEECGEHASERAPAPPRSEHPPPPPPAPPPRVLSFCCTPLSL